MEEHEIKAMALVLSFLGFLTWEQAKQAAFITCVEILRLDTVDGLDRAFWNKVAKSIEKL